MSKKELKLKTDFRWDKIFKIGATCAGAYVLLVIVIMFVQLLTDSWLVWEKEGLGFITGMNWNPVEGRESFGALPYIAGTLVTSLIAMCIAVPLSIGIAMFLSEIAPPSIREPVSFIVELLAAVPSIIYGLWGLFTFRILFKDWFESPTHDALGEYIWLFADAPFGLDILTASIVLAIMIIPTISAVSREILLAVPAIQREAAYMLGATKWEVFKMSVLPYAKSGLIGASILGLGRAVGETMAVTMLIGNAVGSKAFPIAFFQQGNSLASIIANEFNEASPVGIYFPALIGLGLILLFVSLGINICAHVIIRKMVGAHEGGIKGF
jgi:phosphate transport system permease protein|uniref:Phosphate transport system permease protein n=1 Tax=uncultured marine thaumarchaeote AD1000_72_F04 TaxID=1455938 RepID=A0A075G2W8_9ARCH|nr:phosphate ABC transporter inner membrane subunit (pstC) [uncultured marine thaumarchaeote AD1000_72_F04]|tara:strand:- start:2731 stop:3705 length:975 start_codon:yes stop_codon:yes gene_type:complete